MLAVCQFPKPIIYCCVSNHIKLRGLIYQQLLFAMILWVGFYFMFYWLGCWASLACLALVASLQLGTHWGLSA